MEKIIPFNKGIHRQPSLGIDGELSECVNLIPQNGELVNVRGMEKNVDGIKGEVLAIHKTYNYINYIYAKESSGVSCLMCCKRAGYSTEHFVIKNEIGEFEKLRVTPIGNILSITTSDGIKFALWEGERYTWLGSIPKISATPFLSSDRYNIPDLIRKFNTDASFDLYLTGDKVGLSKEKCAQLYEMEADYITLDDEQKEKIRNHVFPIINKFDRLFSKDGYFTSSFYVVLAYKMYDGSYIGKTAPILLTPTTFNKPILDLDIKEDGTTAFDTTFLASKLYVNVENVENIDAWDGLISGISVFVSEQYRDYVDSIDSIESVGIAKYVTKSSNGTIGTKPEDIPRTMRYDGERKWSYVDYEKTDNNEYYILNPFSWETGRTYLIPKETKYDKKYYAFKDDSNDFKMVSTGGVELSKADISPEYLGLPSGRYAIYDCTNLATKYVVISRDAEVYKCQGPTEKEAEYLISLYNINYGRTDGKTISDFCAENSVFYKLADIELTHKGVQEIELRGGELLNLTSNESINYSELFNANFIPSISKEYNRRINHAAVDMIYLPCSPLSVQNILETQYNYNVLSIYVRIVDKGQTAYVEVDNTGDVGYEDVISFSYPSANARSLIIFIKDYFNNTYRKLEVGLDMHKILDLSYAFNNYNQLLWKSYDISKNDYNDEIRTYNTNRHIYKYNTIISSKVDNPFVLPRLSNSSFNESILFISTASKALSQGQFGQFPLYVFCADGIWALEVNSDGTFSAKQPISRDVCNNPNSITQIDGAVVFATEQGLKLIQGSEVVLLSGHLDGSNANEADYFKDINGGKFFKHFNMGEFDKLVNPETRDIRDILKDCQISYDYVNQLLRIFPKRQKNEQGEINTRIPYKYYVYSFTTQEFATVIGDEFANGEEYDEVTTVVPDYPSSIVQIGQKLYRPMETEREGLQNGLLLTRPLLFDEPFALKKLQDMRLQYSKFNHDSKCKVILYASNDGKKWTMLKSLRGGSYKYFRIAVVTKLSDADALTGAIVRCEVERNNKLR